MKITSKTISAPPSGDQHQNNSSQFIPMQTYGYANVSHSCSLSWYISPDAFVITFNPVTSKISSSLLFQCISQLNQVGCINKGRVKMGCMILSPSAHFIQMQIQTHSQLSRVMELSSRDLSTPSRLLFLNHFPINIQEILRIQPISPPISICHGRKHRQR